MAFAGRTPAVCWMRLSNLGDGRDDISGHSYLAAIVVPGDVVGHDPEEWGRCLGIAASLGLAPVRDSLDVAA